VGVAVGTLIPAVVVLMFVVFPKACRVVGLSVWDAFRAAVWPAVWPALPSGALLVACRAWIGTATLLTLAAATGAGMIYVATFFLLAIPGDERRWYGSKLSSLLRRPALLPG